MLESDSRKYDAVAGVTAFGLVMFSWFIYRDGNRLYYFDMKPAYYKELLLAVLIPCDIGNVFARFAYWLEKEKYFEILKRFLYLCGRATIPIMFMHVPLNHWKDCVGYGRLEYMVIGIGIPLMIIFAFNENSVMRKVLGIPKLNR